MKRLALYIAAPLLCTLSASCSIYLWASEQSTIEAMILFGGFALGLELCKFGFFPWARELKRVWSVALYLVAFVLVLISVGATVSLLETGAINNISQARTSSDSYQSAKNTLKSVELEIESLQNLIKADIKNDYRGRALSQGERLTQLRARKQLAVIALNNVNIAPASGMQSAFNTIAKQLNTSDSTVRFWVYLMVALAFDVLAIISIMLLSAPATSDIAEKLQVIAPEITDCNNLKLVETNDCEIIKKDIAAGLHGKNPVVTKVMERTGLRHPKIKSIFDALLNESVLVKNGRSYQLVKV